jgi:hypothetical protein
VTASAPIGPPTSTTPKRDRSDLEHKEQVKLFEWADETVSVLPDLEMMYAVPNGSHKSMAQAVKFKREGLRSGVPDVALDSPVGSFHGLRIEMKSPGADGDSALGLKRKEPGKLKDGQANWLVRLHAKGYAVAVCWTFEQARNVVQRYLAGKHSNEPYLKHIILPVCAKRSRN